MKALILYSTKHGAASEVARRIANCIDGAELRDLKQGDIPDLAGFDCVIVGSSLYAGSIRKEAKIFLSNNKDKLQNKRLGLFLCGIAESGEKKYFEDNFPPKLLQAAVATSFLGGIFEPQKANAIERFIMKIVTKQAERIDNVDNEKIKQFAQALKG